MLGKEVSLTSSSTPLLSSARSKQWLRMMEIGLFDDVFAQRVNASFQYLDYDGVGYFTLKDLTERGRVVFSYLDIDVDSDTFAVMDVFRRFDKSGTGRVTIEEFVLSTIDRLHKLSSDHSCLETITDEILFGGVGSEKVTNLIILMEEEKNFKKKIDVAKTTTPAKCHLLHATLHSLIYIFISRLKIIQLKYDLQHAEEKVATLVSLSGELSPDPADLGGHDEPTSQPASLMLNSQSLAEVLSSSLVEATGDLISHFHLGLDALLDAMPNTGPRLMAALRALSDQWNEDSSSKSSNSSSSSSSGNVGNTAGGALYGNQPLKLYGNPTWDLSVPRRKADGLYFGDSIEGGVDGGTSQGRAQGLGTGRSKVSTTN